MKKKTMTVLLLAALCLALFLAPALAETRQGVIALEGQEEPIEETMFASLQGFTLWYAADRLDAYEGEMAGLEGLVVECLDTCGYMVLEIIPEAQITARSERYTSQNATAFDSLLTDADIIIDAIDSVDCKAHLIRRCADHAANGGKPILLSSMGAALRTDPTKVRTAPFHKVTGDGLARALRNRFRKDGIALPRHLCVYSEEPPKVLLDSSKGSIMPVTCAFGMTLAALVINQIAQPT